MNLYLIHGFCLDNSIWKEMVKYLSDIRIVYIGLPGYNGSIVKKYENIEMMAENCAEAISEPGILVGHSMGGYLALQILKLIPDKIKGLMLFHSHCYADTADKKQVRQKHIEFINRNGSLAYYKELIPGLFKNKKNKKAEKLIKKGLQVQNDTLINDLEIMIQRPEMLEYISMTNKPLGFVIGDHDTILNHSDWIRQTIFPTVSDVYILKDAAHLGMIEKPKLSALAILKFVSVCKLF